MKYLILIIAFLAVSCEQSSYRVDNYILNNDIPFRRIAHFEYRNHKYIFFRTGLDIGGIEKIENLDLKH